MLPEGIYQIVDCDTLNDFASKTQSLPVPKQEIQSDETFLFWFTELGMKEYGQYFFNLIDLNALQFLKGFHMFLYIMQETKETFKLYEDKYQIAYPYDICQFALEEGVEVTLSNIDDILKEVEKYVKET